METAQNTKIMVRIYRIKKEFWFLKSGLFIVENTNGDFYLSMTDEEVIESPIKSNGSLVIDGGTVRADKEHFELISKFPDYDTYVEITGRVKNNFLSPADAKGVLELRCQHCQTDVDVNQYADTCPNCEKIGYLTKRK